MIDHKGPEGGGYSESLMHNESMRQCSNELSNELGGVPSQQMDMVGSAIMSSSLNSPRNAASKNRKKKNAQPWKKSPEDNAASKASDLVSTPCVSVQCDQVNAVHCPKEDSQLNSAKVVRFSSRKHSKMQNKNTVLPRLEDIVPTGWESADSELPEAGCSEVKSSCSHLPGVAQAQSVPCDSGCRSLNACQNSSHTVGTGVVRSNSGHTRFNSQVNSNRSRWKTMGPNRKAWSRNATYSSGCRKPWMDSRGFGKAGSHQTYESNSSVVNASIAPGKCFENEAWQYQISASNSRLPMQTNKAKPMGQEGSHFIWRRRESYNKNQSLVAETRGMSSLLSNPVSGSGQQPSSELPYAVLNAPCQNADRWGGVRDRIYRSCGQEAASLPMWTFHHGFGTSGGQCLSVPVQSSATGYLAWEGSMLGMYQPYSLEASQYLATPGWESYIYCGQDYGTSLAIDLSLARHGDSQDNYGHEFFYSGMYHFDFMPTSAWPQNLMHGIPPHAQLSFVPSDYLGAMFPTGYIIRGPDQMPIGLTPEESKDSDASSNTGVKSNKKAKVSAGCDATCSNAEREIGHKIDRADSDLTNSARSYEALQRSDGNKNRLEKGLEEIQIDSCAHWTASGDQFTFICSQKTAQALAASWKSQVASECILEATGSPICPFERLLYAASPVVAFSSYKCPEESSSNKLSSSLLSKLSWPDISLMDVWKWYMECGSFGLEVKVEDCRNSDSFTAYFSPSLSALQLFRHSQNSLSGNLEKLSIDVPKTGNSEKCSGWSSSLDSTSLKQTAEPSVSDIPSSVRRNHSVQYQIDDSSAPAICFSDDAEVIFEYFEQDPPQQRKPLHEKIVDIKKLGSSNPHSYGDPSKLDRLKLRDLHPASWYSVAWYPILRIPENNRSNVPTLRASFLTYHSLSHLVMRHENPDHKGNSAFCAVPALGMRNYNGKDECWFQPRKFAGPVSIDGMPSDISKFLEERLRTLEEVAAIFSDGHVRKNGITTPNKHSDYDFFIRRT